MAIIGKQVKSSIVGKVLKFTFDQPGIPDKYFEVVRPDQSRCFCKGKIIPDKDIIIGSNIKLFGEWKVNQNPKYRSMREQFYFSTYELIPSMEAETQMASGVSRPSTKEPPIQKEEEIRGYIVRFRPFTNNYRILLLHLTDGRELWCQGNIDPSKPPYENNKVRLLGTWRTNPRRPEYGLQFYFTSCDIITPDKPEKVIRRTRKGIPKITSTIAGDNVAEKVAAYLKAIGKKKITYEFHSPKHASIVAHVRAQLDERILRSNRDDNDFFFLTAILDRNVKDELTQSFRKSNRFFKRDLLLCWKEAEGALLKATDDIRLALSDKNILKEVSDLSPTYRKLDHSIPWKNGIDQLLACLRVIRDLYKRSENSSIADFVKDINSEREIRTYLRGIDGIGPKLANWSLTNVTGHWFVIDEPHIKPLIEKDLADTLPAGMAVSLESANAIFEHWFGKLNEISKEYEGFSRKEFAAAFPDFPVETCEYLPFIVTQYLWFYEKYYGDGEIA